MVRVLEYCVGPSMVWSVGTGARFALVAALAALSSFARAEEAPTNKVASPASYEIWTGADATSQYWSVWSGLTYAPLGSVSDPGVRLRINAGGGQYRYAGTTLVGGLATPATLTGTSTFAEALAGYQAQVGRWTAKLFLGIHYQELHASAAELNPRNRSALGFKIAFENWLELTPSLWASLDASWSHANDNYWSRARLGHRVLPELSLGIEAQAFGHDTQHMRRGGLFARYDGRLGEIIVSGGIADQEAAARSAYFSANWLGRF